MPKLLLFSLFAFASSSLLQAQVETPRAVAFFQAGFPTVASEPISQAALSAAIPGLTFADIDQLHTGNAFANASLLILPYGSAVPMAAWPDIKQFLHHGGNLLIIGGQALHVPVTGEHAGSFVAQSPQDSYSRELGFLHTYAVPMPAERAHFAWREGYDFLPRISVQATTIYAEEGRLNGLGYLEGSDGTRLASPIIVSDHLSGDTMSGSRIVALPFGTTSAFWASADGKALLHTAAQYAEAGATSFSVEAQYNALRPGESLLLTLHLRQQRTTLPPGQAHVELREGERVIESANLALGGNETSVPVRFSKPLQSGVYTVRATWTPTQTPTRTPDAPVGKTLPQEFADNGVVLEELSALEAGPALGTHGDFLSLGGKPFLPVGTNYFSTDANGWDFSGPRNGATWERDFADMQRHGVSFVRTGVWMQNSKFVEPLTGEANERFLRNLEAFLSAAHRHNIAVNFTCFAFTPHGLEQRNSSDTTTEPPVPNPYLDAATVSQEQAYVISIVRRFRNVPWLSYDLINEPSFSNLRHIFHGNIPNGDPAEVAAWHSWLQLRYGSLAVLASTWRVTPEELGSFNDIPLPQSTDLAFDRYGNQHEVRAFDYNLFAQDMFSTWVRGMVDAIHRTGSTQLINVGQDEGGVTDRLLNQFYATAGISFTTNHTYWHDEALLWDSIAAKRPGLPNITGETGYQPAWNPDGTWRYDELTGSAIEERKWALGFAVGSSGAMQWDWDREVDFGMQRSDGSAKIWENMMRDLGDFAKAAAPYATGLLLPEIAIILPQSLQLSVYNSQALAAQQMAVRVLYQHNRMEGYAVGEYQTDTLGNPKLILLPSVYGLSQKAWSDIEARVRAGAILLISGPFWRRRTPSSHKARRDARHICSAHGASAAR